MKTIKTNTIILFLIVLAASLAAVSCEQSTGDQGGIAEAEPAIEIADSFDFVSPFARFNGGDQDCKQPAFDSFLKLKDIDGGSTDADYEGWIEIFSWGWGASNSGTLHNSGRGIGRVRMKARPFAITKPVDKASHKLQQAIADGVPISTGMFVLRTTCGERQEKSLVIEMEDVVITSHQSAGSSGDSSQRIPTESLSFSYSKIALLLPAIQKAREAAR